MLGVVQAIARSTASSGAEDFQARFAERIRALAAAHDLLVSNDWQGVEIAGQPAHAIVRRGIALSPEGWRLFVQQTVEQNLRLGASPLPHQRRVPELD